MFRFNLPTWTDDFSKAIAGTMADAARSKSGSRSSESRLNLIDNYLTVVLLAFIDAELPSTLVHVITRCKDKFLATRATVLLGEILHLGNQLLPSHISGQLHSLPYLISMSLDPTMNPDQSSRARLAIRNLEELSNLRHAVVKSAVEVCVSVYVRFYMNMVKRFSSVSLLSIHSIENESDFL